MNGYEKIKRLAKEKKCNIPELLVLARQNDPFFTGSDTNKAMAEWFVDVVYNQYGGTNGLHLRKVHYRLVTLANIKKHNGEVYENTENDWGYICNAGKYARHLGLINPGALLDQRNPEPHIFNNYEILTEPSWDYDFPEWDMPRIETNLTTDLYWRIPDYYIHGYDYHEELQPYHTEVWIEKSTMNDELIPLCRRYGVNLVTGLGFMSIKSVVELINRIIAAQKPCKILYISDFDPGGLGMPTAVARQIEYYLSTHDLNLDIKLEPIMLTKEQAVKYKLPRTPIKDSDRRKGNFEEIYGQGAVELDALSALYPGEFQKIVKGYIQEFRDEKLVKKMYEAYEEADEELSGWWESWIEPHQKELDNLSGKVEEIVNNYKGRLEELNGQMEAEIEPYNEEINAVRQAIQTKLDSLIVEIPALPEAKIEPEKDDWLFDSSRDYFTQLAVYKDKKQGK